MKYVITVHRTQKRLANEAHGCQIDYKADDGVAVTYDFTVGGDGKLWMVVINPATGLSRHAGMAYDPREEVNPCSSPNDSSTG